MSSTIIDRLDGLSSSVAIKGPCRVATTVDIALYGFQTIDGVAVIDGDRVLVKAQDAGYENGIYVVSTGQWRRSRDFNKTRDVVKGTAVFVTEGAAHGETLWVVTTENTVDVGTDSISFSDDVIIPPDSSVGLPQLTPELIRVLLPLTPESFPGATMQEKMLAAAAAAVSQNRPLQLTDGQTYIFSKMTFPPNLRIVGNGVLRSDSSLTNSADVTLTLGANTVADSLTVSTAGSETNLDILSIGAGCKIGRLEVRSDTQRAGGGITTAAEGVYIGYLVTRKIDRPIDLNNQSAVAQTTGAYIGFLDVRDYVRAFRAVYCSFTLGGMRAQGRSPNATKSPGHNGVLIIGCANWSMGDLWIENAGEHAFRIGGSDVSASPTAVTKNYKIGVIVAIRPGGCAFKVNPTKLISPGVTEKAANGIVEGVVGIDVGDPADGGNEELLRITHVAGLKIGFAQAFVENYSVSCQYFLQVNDAIGLEIEVLGGDASLSGFISVDGTSDVDGVATFGGDVSALRIGRMFGITNGNNGISVNTLFNLGRVSIGFDGIRGFASNVLIWAAGTLVDIFEMKGRVTGSVAPAYSGVPNSDNFLVDIAYTNKRTAGRGANSRGSAMLELLSAVFAPGDVLPTGLFLSAAASTPGSGNYGAGLEFSRVGSQRRGAALALLQTGTSVQNTGVELLVGNSTAGTDQLIPALRVSHERALLIPDGIAAPATTSGWATLYVDTADGDLKMKFGDGVVKTIVIDT